MIESPIVLESKDHKIYYGDCLSLLPKLKGGKIAMVLCDLPYGTTNCKWDSIIPFDKLWGEYFRLCDENAVIALFGQEPFSSIMRLSQLPNYKYDWIWDKVKPGAFAVAKYCPLKQHELISIFCRGKANYQPIMVDRKYVKKSHIYASSDSASVKY